MLTLKNTEVIGWEPSIRGMRNPMNSWAKSDTDFSIYGIQSINGVLAPTIGPNDEDLMRRLCKAGPVHAKFRRMIKVYVDITAPLYWWKEFDTYKVGTVANSCSTMHKIHAKEFTLDDFSIDKMFETDSGWIESVDGVKYLSPITFFEGIVHQLNVYRNLFLDTKNKVWWEQMIQLLPTSYNQTRTVELNYEVLVGMYRDRKNHKLDEWHTLCDWIKTLPYSWLITGEENNDGET